MTIIRAYRTELAACDWQLRMFREHVGLARFAYNWGLRRKIDVLSFNRLPISPIKIPSAIDLHRELNALKQTHFRWMYDMSKCAPQEALRNLDAAFKNFFKGRARFPRFKSRKGGAGSFRLTGAIHVRPGKIKLPRLGWVRLKENGYLALSQYERKLKHLQRTVSRRRRGSSNRRKARAALARLHLRITNVRNDALHQATSRLARTKSVVVVEDLGVRGLMSNHRLAKSIADAGWSEFVRQLGYKTAWYGSRLVVADRFYPSTRTCSLCGHIRESMPLSERRFCCDRCGRVMDRDLNAAVNLSRWPGVARTLETPVEGGVQPAATSAQPSCEAGTISLDRGPNRWMS